MLLNGKAPAFQAGHVGSTPITRSMFLPMKYTEFHKVAFIALCTVIVCSGGVATAGGVQASAKPLDSDAEQLISFYTDSVLNSLEGRKWILCDGFSGEQLAERAKSRGYDGLVVMPGRQTTELELETFEASVQSLGSQKLEAAAMLGSVPFALAWMEERPDAAATNLALAAWPSLSAFAGFEAVPSGLIYLLEKPQGVGSNQLQKALVKYLRERDAVGEMVSVTPNGVLVDALKKRISSQTAMSGNNLGVLLYNAGMTNDALNVFMQASAIDKDNLSALLNKATVVREGVRPELMERFAGELNQLARAGGGSWTLAATAGYVLKPEYFLEAGWIWTFSGICATDTNSFSRAIGAVEDERMRAAIKQQMPLSRIMQTAGSQAQMMLLAEFPKDGLTWEYLMKIAETHLMMGDALRAERAVKKAAAMPDADAVLVAFMRSDVLRRTGKYNEAVEAVLAVKNVENAENVLRKCASIYSHIGDNAKLLEVVKELGAMDGASEWIGLSTKSLESLIANDVPMAKKFSDQAIKAGADADFVFRSALLLDMMTNDTVAAGEHADMALSANALDFFANYVKATILVGRKDYKNAERHFQISMSQNPAWFVANDYAAMVVEIGNFQLAENLANAALASGGDAQPAVWDTLAAALAGLGKKGDALEALKKAVALPGGDDPRVQLRYAELSLENGDKEAAAKAIGVIYKNLETLSISERERLGVVRKAIE